MGMMLICPNQVRANGIKVEDVPRQFDPLSSHSIFDPKSKIRKPLTIEGVASGVVSRKPTLDEYEEYEYIELTSPTMWEPFTCREGKSYYCTCFSGSRRVGKRICKECDMTGQCNVVDCNDDKVHLGRRQRPSKQTGSSGEHLFQ